MDHRSDFFSPFPFFPWLWHRRWFVSRGILLYRNVTTTVSKFGHQSVLNRIINHPLPKHQIGSLREEIRKRHRLRQLPRRDAIHHTSHTPLPSTLPQLIPGIIQIFPSKLTHPTPHPTRSEQFAFLPVYGATQTTKDPMLASYAPVMLRQDGELSPEMSPELGSKGPSPRTPLNQATAANGEVQRKKKKRPSKWWWMRRLLFVLCMVALLGLGSVMMFRFIKTDEFNDVINWIQNHELIGSAVYIGTFTLFIILCFPSTAFELLAGYIFGFWLGLLLASIGKLSGSVISFFIGRYLCRRRVKEYMERGHPVFKAFQSLLRKRQILIVFLTRIAFFPIAMKNYGLSVLDVSFAVYFSAALLTGLPFSIIWVYSGNAAQHLTTLLSSNKSKNKTEAIFLIVGASSALLLLFLIGFYTRKHILMLAAEEETTALRDAKDKQTATHKPRRASTTIAIV